MFYILDPEGHVYIDGQTLSGPALDRAVLKYAPHARGTYQKQQTWATMKALGYSVLNQPSAQSSGVCCPRSLETGGRRHNANCGREPVDAPAVSAEGGQS